MDASFVIALLTHALAVLIDVKKLPLTLGTNSLRRANHICRDESLNAEGINQTLQSLFQRNMVHSMASPATFVAGHLFACFKIPLLRLNHQDEFGIFIDRSVFQEYLEDLGGDVEVLYYNCSNIMGKFRYCIAIIV